MRYGGNTVAYDIIAMLIDAVLVGDTHFPIRYRLDGKLFNQRKFKTIPKVHIDVLDKILFADDIDKVND